MFDGLDEQMKRDEQAGTTSMERYMKYLAVAVGSILLLSGAYFGLKLIE